jgi:hypothetical protein
VLQSVETELSEVRVRLIRREGGAQLHEFRFLAALRGDRSRTRGPTRVPSTRCMGPRAGGAECRTTTSFSSGHPSRR